MRKLELYLNHLVCHLHQLNVLVFKKFEMTTDTIADMLTRIRNANLAKHQIVQIPSTKVTRNIAQGLFDNCFQIFEGPDAPDVTARELDREVVLYLTNPITSNNVGESYRLARPEIPADRDQFYNFEGYIVYQLKDNTVSVADLDNNDVSRIVYQGDIKNYNTDSLGKELLDSIFSSN